MRSLTLDDKTLALLNQVKDLIEIRDSSGSVVGFYAPLAIEDAHLYADVAAHCDLAEMERRKNERQPGRTTAEVLDRLRAAEKS